MEELNLEHGGLKMKTIPKIEFPKVIKPARFSSTPEQEKLREESIEARREFWNSLFKEWGYKEIAWPREFWHDNFTLDGITIYFKNWDASEGRCYIRQDYGNDGIWSFFEIDKPVNIDKVKDTVKKIWETKSDEKLATKNKENRIEYNKSTLPEGHQEEFYDRNIIIETKQTCFEVHVDYDFIFTFDLSGNLIKFSTPKTFNNLYGYTSIGAFDKLRKEIDAYEAKVSVVEKELIEWFKGIKKD